MSLRRLFGKEDTTFVMPLLLPITSIWSHVIMPNVLKRGGVYALDDVEKVVASLRSLDKDKERVQDGFEDLQHVLTSRQYLLYYSSATFENLEAQVRRFELSSSDQYAHFAHDAYYADRAIWRDRERTTMARHHQGKIGRRIRNPEHPKIELETQMKTRERNHLPTQPRVGQVCGTKEALRGSRDPKAPGEQAPVCEVHDSTTPFGSQNVDERKGDLLSVIHEKPEANATAWEGGLYR
jgi:hypothetical protein